MRNRDRQIRWGCTAWHTDRSGLGEEQVMSIPRTLCVSLVLAAGALGCSHRDRDRDRSRPGSPSVVEGTDPTAAPPSPANNVMTPSSTNPYNAYTDTGGPADTNAAVGTPSNTAPIAQADTAAAAANAPGVPDSYPGATGSPDPGTTPMATDAGVGSGGGRDAGMPAPAPKRGDRGGSGAGSGSGGTGSGAGSSMR
jgi:hypothetical protein